MCDKTRLLKEINQKIKWELLNFGLEGIDDGITHLNILDLIERSTKLIEELE